jgi:hypothetical protein
VHAAGIAWPEAVAVRAHGGESWASTARRFPSLSRLARAPCVAGPAYGPPHDSTVTAPPPATCRLQSSSPRVASPPGEPICLSEFRGQR